MRTTLETAGFASASASALAVLAVTVPRPVDGGGCPLGGGGVPVIFDLYDHDASRPSPLKESKSA